MAEPSAGFELVVEGEIERPLRLGFAALRSLPGQIDDLASRVPGRSGGAVPLEVLLERAGAKPEARFVTLVAADGAFAIAVPLAALVGRALVCYRLGEAPLPAGQGGPVRFFVADAPDCAGRPGAEVDACANVKRLGAIRLTREREPDRGHAHH